VPEPRHERRGVIIMMPKNLLKARLEEISWDDQQQIIEGEKKIPVQFNPQSLKVALSNQKASGDQRGGSAIQFVGSGTTKLSFDLWFDVTNPEHNQRKINEFIPDDVRLLTEEVAFFMKAEPSDEEGKFIPPGVRFIWGRFLFEGVMDSLNEELSYFSEDGRPLRAKISVALSRQEIQFSAGRQTANGAQSGASSGAPKQQAKDGDTVADVAGRDGKPDNWPAVAALNGIENPLQLEAGIVIDTSASVGIGISGGLSGGFSADFGGALSAGAGGGLSAGASLGAGGSLGGGLRAGASAGGGAGGGIGAGASGGIGAGASGGIGAGASGGIGAGASGGIGAGASGGIGAGTSGGIGAGATGGIGAGTTGGIGAGASLGGGAGTGAGATTGGAATSAAASASASFDERLRR